MHFSKKMFEFSKRESIFLIFLLICFIVGTGLKIKNVSLDRKSISVENKQNLDKFEKDLLAAHEKIKVLKKNKNKNISVIDINQALKEDFIRLPNIGPIRAQRIIEYRESIGKFNKIDELLNVKGIGKKTLSKMAIYLKIEN